MLNVAQPKAGKRNNGGNGKGHDSVSEKIPALHEVKLTDNARIVLEKRYLRRGPDGKPVENIEQMFWRVAYNVALAEKEWSGDVEQVAQSFYDLLTHLNF